MVWYGTVWYGTVWYGMVRHGMVWYRMGMVWYGMVSYGTVWYTVRCHQKRRELEEGREGQGKVVGINQMQRGGKMSRYVAQIDVPILLTFQNSKKTSNCDA